MRQAYALPGVLGRVALALAVLGMVRLGVEAEPEPEAPISVESAAEAVLAARLVGDGRLSCLAIEGWPDPWLVADELLARDQGEVARAFAALVSGVDALGLRAWLAATSEPGTEEGAARRQIAAAEQALSSGDPTRALAALETSTAQGPVLTVRLARLRGTAARALGRDAEAAALFAKAGEQAEAIGWRSWAAQAFGEAGGCAGGAGDHDLAARCFDRAASAAAARDDVAAEAEALTGLGRARQQQGDLAAAMDALRRALALRARQGAPAATATTLRALGLVHEDAGAYDEARDAQTAALATSEAAGDAPGRAAALGHLGGLHWRLGEYARSLACQETALGILESLGDVRRAAATLANLGIVYQRLGDTDRALACYERAAVRLRESGAAAQAATVLANLGGLYVTLGERERALGYLAQAREAFEQAGDRAGVAATLTNAGYVQLALGNLSEALRAHEAALSVREALGDRVGAVEGRTALALVQAASGDPERALVLLRRAVSEAEQLAAQDALVVALWATAAVRLQVGEPSEAVVAARRAIEEMPAMVGGLSDEHGALVRQRLSPVFETGLKAAIALGSPEQAAYFLESGRAGALLESLGGRERLHDVVLPADLRETEARARAEEARALARYRRTLDGQDLAAMRASAAERDRARQGVREAIDRIQRQAKSAAHLVYPRATALDSLRSGLRLDEALVIYATLPDRTLALVITRDGARLVALGSTDAVARASADVSRTSSPASEPAEAVAALGARVAAPLALPASIRRVLISPDGPLAYVPFALLFEGRETICVPSGSTWRLLAGEARRRGEGVLALGDPDYDTDGPGTNQLARMSSGVGFAPLHHTREEARAVGDVVLLGADATEAGFRYAVGRRPRWRAVHLACHGVVDPKTPLLSALALTPAGDDDGFLTAMDVLRLRIDTDLVVLSACRTGYGQVVRGEGVIGFVRAFMFAGTSRVLVSLWNGDDAATHALMVAFHAALRAGRPTGTALAQAQAEVRAQARWSHPYYWAGWTLWGDPD